MAQDACILYLTNTKKKNSIEKHHAFFVVVDGATSGISTGKNINILIAIK